MIPWRPGGSSFHGIWSEGNTSTVAFDTCVRPINMRGTMAIRASAFPPARSAIRPCGAVTTRPSIRASASLTRVTFAPVSTSHSTRELPMVSGSRTPRVTHCAFEGIRSASDLEVRGSREHGSDLRQVIPGFRAQHLVDEFARICVAPGAQVHSQLAAAGVIDVGGLLCAHRRQQCFKHAGRDELAQHVSSFLSLRSYDVRMLPDEGQRPGLASTVTRDRLSQKGPLFQANRTLCLGNEAKQATDTRCFKDLEEK